MRGAAACLAILCGCASDAPAGLARLGAAQLLVTEGTLEELQDQRLVISEARVRAVSRARAERSAELRFSYLGPSAQTRALESGERRRQIGLKLRARDGCNVIYVMWRVEPESGLDVSFKRNPGDHASDECGVDGYVTIKPARATEPPRVLAGEPHALRGDLRGDALQVSADRTVIWEGRVPAKALSFDGPIGLRTDNGRFELELWSGAPDPA